MPKSDKQAMIEEFKEFIRLHPKLIEEVRKGEKKWKDIFEDWRLLGSQDPIWDKYKDEKESKRSSSNGKSSLWTSLLTTFQKMDVDQVNENLYKMNDAISSIQELIQKFSPKHPQTRKIYRENPFLFRKD